MFAIGETALQSGVSVETIRYYEREGIIPAPGRTVSGRRVYSQEEVDRLSFIRKCRDLGFSIADICRLMALEDDPVGDCARIEEIGRQHLEDVRNKMARLQKMEQVLEQLLANCKAGEARCPMLESLRN